MTPDSDTTPSDIGALSDVALAPEDPSTTAFGVSASDLQTDLAVSNGEITGTLNAITDSSAWDAGTWGSGEDTGYYMFLKATGIPEGATATVELINGVHGPVTLDSDLNIILRISDRESQEVQLTVTLDEETVTKTYVLTNLNLYTFDDPLGPGNPNPMPVT